MFLLEPFLREETADFGGLDNLLVRLYFCLQITAFQAENAVRQGVLLMFGDVFLNNLHQIGQGHNGTTDNKVVETFLILTTQVGGLAVLQSDGITHFLGYTDLLACTIDQLELTIGEEDGQRNAGKTSAGAEIENLGAGTETDDLGNRHRVKHMVFVEVVDVLTGDDVDLLVPIAIKGVKGLYLLTLLRRQVGKVFTDEWMHG